MSIQCVEVPKKITFIFQTNKKAIHYPEFQGGQTMRIFCVKQTEDMINHVGKVIGQRFITCECGIQGFLTLFTSILGTGCLECCSVAERSE